jgi:hypothetical protein
MHWRVNFNIDTQKEMDIVVRYLKVLPHMITWPPFHKMRTRWIHIWILHILLHNRTLNHPRLMNLNAKLTMVHVHDNYSGCLNKHHCNFGMHNWKILFGKKCDMWVSNLYSVESILYLWPRYEVDIDLCSSDARPWSLDSDTWMNCAISLTCIHISFLRGHRNHTRALRVFLSLRQG